MQLTRSVIKYLFDTCIIEQFCQPSLAELKPIRVQSSLYINYMSSYVTCCM